MKTKTFLEPMITFQFTGFPDQFQYRMILFFHDKIYLVLPLGFVMFLWPPPSLPHWQLIVPPLFILRLRQLIPLHSPWKLRDPPNSSALNPTPPPPPPSSPLPKALNKGSSLKTAKGSNEKYAKYLPQYPYTQSLSPSSDPSGVVCGPNHWAGI